ncbi:MAG: dephospho-CoA kinase [Lachnospiraceae bacterium]|nr:dephospho-CoA kinase [Lachnospiraceae bacterium]
MQNRSALRIIGITGGVGSGKTGVLNFLKDNYNCRIIVSDELAKDLCFKGRPCYRPLIKLLGKDVLDGSGEIDRKVMASKIFSDDSLRQGVNDIIHPAVRREIERIADKERRSGKIDFLFIEAALLIECGYGDFVDEMWYVYACESVRRERLKASRGYTDEKCDSIMQSQLSEEEFRRNSDFTIDNSGEWSDTFSQIRERIG